MKSDSKELPPRMTNILPSSVIKIDTVPEMVKIIRNPYEELLVDDRVSCSRSVMSYISNKMKNLRGINKKLKSKLLDETRKFKRCKTKLEKLQDILKNSRRNDEFTEETFSGLTNDLNKVPEALLSRFLKNKKLNIYSRQEYPPELRKFAISLHFYSPKAYEYVRGIFDKALPSSSTIRNWYSSVDCEPGFISEAFNFLKEKCKNGARVALAVDEMSIMKNIDLRGNKERGFVDKGNGEESDEEATEALVMMATCYHEHWKVPIAYFFIKSMSAVERKNLVNEALIRLYDCNVEVVSITCDGPVTNISMLKKLGKWCQLFNLKTLILYFIFFYL